MVKRKSTAPIKLDFSTLSWPLTKPWPLADNSVEEATIAHRLEYIRGADRVHVMEELWRVLIVGGKASIIVCYWSSPRAIQDPALEWPPFCEQSFLYFNRGWREQNKLPAIACDFDFTYGYAADPETAARNQESQSFWIKHYLNTVLDLQVVVTKRAIDKLK